MYALISIYRENKYIFVIYVILFIYILIVYIKYQYFLINIIQFISLR